MVVSVLGVLLLANEMESYTVVAVPPKLYGPHVLVIVLKTSNNHTCVPQNLRSLSGVLGKPESSTFLQLKQDQQRSNYNITAFATKLTPECGRITTIDL
jgi:hypothetical protein